MYRFHKSPRDKRFLEGIKNLIRAHSKPTGGIKNYLTSHLFFHHGKNRKKRTKFFKVNLVKNKLLIQKKQGRKMDRTKSEFSSENSKVFQKIVNLFSILPRSERVGQKQDQTSSSKIMT